MNRAFKNNAWTEAADGPKSGGTSVNVMGIIQPPPAPAWNRVKSLPKTTGIPPHPSDDPVELELSANKYKLTLSVTKCLYCKWNSTFANQRDVDSYLNCI